MTPPQVNILALNIHLFMMAHVFIVVHIRDNKSVFKHINDWYTFKDTSKKITYNLFIRYQ